MIERFLYFILLSQSPQLAQAKICETALHVLGANNSSKEIAWPEWKEKWATGFVDLLETSPLSRDQLIQVRNDPLNFSFDWNSSSDKESHGDVLQKFRELALEKSDDRKVELIQTLKEKIGLLIEKQARIQQNAEKMIAHETDITSVKKIIHKDAIESLDYNHPNFMTVGVKGSIKLLDATDGREILKLPRIGDAAVRLSSDARTVIAVTGNLYDVWDIEKGKRVLSVSNFFRKRPYFVFNSNKKFVLMVLPNSVSLHDATTFKKLKTFQSKGEPEALSNDGKLAVIILPDRSTLLWRTDTGKTEDLLKGFSVQAASFSPDGKFLVMSGTLNGIPTLGHNVHLWNLANSTSEFLDFGGPISTSDFIAALAFSPNGNFVVSGSSEQDGRVIEWNLKTKKLARSFTTGRKLFSVRYTPDGRYINLGAVEKTIMLMPTPPDRWSEESSDPAPIFKQPKLNFFQQARELIRRALW